MNSDAGEWLGVGWPGARTRSQGQERSLVEVELVVDSWSPQGFGV